MNIQAAEVSGEACGDSSVGLMAEKAEASIARTGLRLRISGIWVDEGGRLPSGNQPELSFASHTLIEEIPIGIEGCCIHRRDQIVEKALDAE